MRAVVALLYAPTVLLLSAELRAAIAGRAGDDARVTLACETAAALHRGRAPDAPLVIATRRAPRCRDRRLRAIAALPLGAPRARIEGVAVTTLEQTVVDLLARPTEPGGVALAGALIREGSALEGRGFDARSFERLVSALGRPALVRRARWVLARAGRSIDALGAAGRGPAIALDPLAAPGGPRVPARGVRINVPDGWPDPRGEVAPLLASELRRRHGALAIDVALAAQAGVRVDASWAAPRLRALHEALERCAREGMLRVTGGEIAPIPPLDEACAHLLRAPARSAARAVSAVRARAEALAEALHATRDDGARADAISVRAAAGDVEGARTALLAIADDVAALDAGRAARLLPLTEGQRACAAIRLRLLERLGRWDTLVQEARSRAADRARARARDATLALARGCWRLGRSRECLAHLDALARALDARPDAALAAEVTLLRASIAVERGEHARAERLLRALLRAAEREGDDFDRARALHRLGALDARRGRLEQAAAAYRAALEILPTAAPRARALRGVLRSNLAATALWLGRWEEAQRLAEQALIDKESSGTFAEVVVTRVLLARIARARGAPVPAAGRMPALVDAAERSLDARLRVEAWLDLAEEHARAGDLRSAQASVERARTALALLAGAEPVLSAIADHVAGVLAARAGDLAAGLATIDAAATALDRQGGAFWAARARRDAASLAERAGGGAIRSASDALERFEAVARACLRGAFVLGEEAEHASLYAHAALAGGPLGRPLAVRVLARLGAATVRAQLDAEGRRALAEALANERPEADAMTPAVRAAAVATLRTPFGQRLVDAAERTALLRGARGVLLLDEGAALLVRPDGTRVALGRRRTLAPLLRAIAARPGEATSVGQLARDVWQRRDGASTRAAVKMSVSRLRALLGPLRDAVQAVRAQGQLAYLWSDAVELHVLTPVHP